MNVVRRYPATTLWTLLCAAGAVAYMWGGGG